LVRGRIDHKNILTEETGNIKARAIRCSRDSNERVPQRNRRNYFQCAGIDCIQRGGIAADDIEPCSRRVQRENGRIHDRYRGHNCIGAGIDYGNTAQVAFGKGIELSKSAGESIGIERIAARASATLFDALDSTIAAGETNLYYEDVYSRLIAAGRLRAEAVSVRDLPWTEVDDFADLERARQLVQSGG